LIAMQKPDAMRVAGFKAWLALGYCVRRGEKALRIFAPCPPSKAKLEAWRDAGADPAEKPRTFFHLTAVFDTLSRDRRWLVEWCGRALGDARRRRRDGRLAAARVRSPEGDEPVPPRAPWGRGVVQFEQQSSRLDSVEGPSRIGC
jgi:hypothetical protein